MEDHNSKISLKPIMYEFDWDTKAITPLYNLANIPHTDLHGYRWQIDRDEIRTASMTYCISTVFLGIDHNVLDSGPPILFETQISGNKCRDDNMERIFRYATVEEAIQGHLEAIKLVLSLTLEERNDVQPL